MTPWLALMALAWYWLLGRSVGRKTVPKATAAAGLTLLALVLLLLEVPYRVFYKSQVPRLQVEGQRCYEVGKSTTNTLLYCPDAPKQARTRIVKSDQIDKLDRTGPEGIFSPSGPPGKN